MRSRRVAILGSTVAALSAALAATLEVSKAPGAPYSTIQSAIDAAVPSVDEVWVRCGRYPENIVMRSGVPVRGEKPRCAFVDGGGWGRSSG